MNWIIGAYSLGMLVTVIVVIWRGERARKRMRAMMHAHDCDCRECWQGISP